MRKDQFTVEKMLGLSHAKELWNLGLESVEEVKSLIELNYDNKAPILNAIGVSEIKEYIKKRITIDEAKDLIKFRTHQYAKRQITWLKHQMISWKSFSTQESDKIIDYFIKKL